MKLEEKQFLWRKLKKKGLTEEQANERIKKFEKHLKELVSKLKKKKMTKEEINLRFKEEFAKVCDNE